MESTLIITGSILIGCLLGLSWFAGSDAPFVRTPDQIGKLLKTAGVKKGKKFYDLGSGDGRLVLEAARMGLISFGIEQSLIRVLMSKWKAKQLKNANFTAKQEVHFIHGNIFAQEYTQADYVYIYLMQQAVDRLERKLETDLKKGSIIITKAYHFKNLKPTKKTGDFWIYKV